MLSAQLSTEKGSTSPIDTKTPHTTSSGETSPLASSPPLQLFAASPKPPRVSPKFSTFPGLPQRTQTATVSPTTTVDIDAKKVLDLQESEEAFMHSIASISLAITSHSAPDVYESTHATTIDSSAAAVVSSSSFVDTSKPMGLPASIMQSKKKKKRFAFGLKKED